MMLYVNMPLSYVAQDDAYLDFFLSSSARAKQQDLKQEPELGPELGLDAWSMQNRSPDWHRSLASRLKNAGVRSGSHLPFLDLSLASLDDLVLEASRERLNRGFALARTYGVDHMVGHPGYNAEMHGAYPDEWERRSRDTWIEALQSWPDHPPLFLENTFDAGPEPLAALVADLQAADVGPVGVCFDIGHWHGLVGGRGEKDLERWLQVLGPYIGHLHLHDNDGSGDQHLAMGRGDIPWEFFFSWLKNNDIAPSITLEPHTEEDFRGSLDYLSRNSELFASVISA